MTGCDLLENVPPLGKKNPDTKCARFLGRDSAGGELLGRCAASRHSTARGREVTGAPEGLRVLVADEDYEALDNLAQLLKELGHRWWRARSAWTRCRAR